MSVNLASIAPDLPRPITLFPRMTTAQFEQLPDSEYTLELLNGEVIMAARPRLDRIGFQFRLARLIEDWIRPRRLGLQFQEPEVRLQEGWTPVPDIAFVATPNAQRLTPERIVGPPELMVEILSPTTETTDRGKKFVEYAKAGVPWYWIVDLDAATLEEYEGVGGAFTNVVTVPFAQPFAPRVFPGLTIDLASLP